MRQSIAAVAAAFVALPALGADDPVLVGVGVRSRPEYDGAASRRADIVPVLRYYGRPWFARTTQGVLEAGARSELASDFHVGAQLAYEAEGKDVGAGISAGLHVEWDRKLGPVPFTFLIRARQNFDTDRGGQADLRISAGLFERAGFLAGTFAQATWGSENAVRSLYGAPNSGVLFTSVGLLGSYDVSRRWILVASFEARRLFDEAAQSAITERKMNYYATGGIAYRFYR